MGEGLLCVWRSPILPQVNSMRGGRQVKDYKGRRRMEESAEGVARSLLFFLSCNKENSVATKVRVPSSSSSSSLLM